MHPASSTGPERPGLLRRLGAICYDALLVFAVLFAATLPVLLLTGGEPVTPANPLYSAYLCATAFLYFAWFWTHGGQTLGMRAWRIRVTTIDGRAIGAPHALKRFLAALVSGAACGLGFLWVLVDSERMAWHDHLSRTALTMAPKFGRELAVSTPVDDD